MLGEGTLQLGFFVQIWQEYLLNFFSGSADQSVQQSELATGEQPVTVSPYVNRLHGASTVVAFVTSLVSNILMFVCGFNTINYEHKPLSLVCNRTMDKAISYGKLSCRRCMKA